MTNRTGIAEVSPNGFPNGFPTVRKSAADLSYKVISESKRLRLI